MPKFDIAHGKAQILATCGSDTEMPTMEALLALLSALRQLEAVTEEVEIFYPYEKKQED